MSGEDRRQQQQVQKRVRDAGSGGVNLASLRIKAPSGHRLQCNTHQETEGSYSQLWSGKLLTGLHVGFKPHMEASTLSPRVRGMAI